MAWTTVATPNKKRVIDHSALDHPAVSHETSEFRCGRSLQRVAHQTHHKAMRNARWLSWSVLDGVVGGPAIIRVAWNGSSLWPSLLGLKWALEVLSGIRSLTNLLRHPAELVGLEWS